MAKLQISSLSLLRIHDCTNNLGVTEEEEVVRCNDYSFWSVHAVADGIPQTDQRVDTAEAHHTDIQMRKRVDD